MTTSLPLPEDQRDRASPGQAFCSVHGREASPEADCRVNATWPGSAMTPPRGAPAVVESAHAVKSACPAEAEVWARCPVEEVTWVRTVPATSSIAPVLPGA